jgi:hypothetical protein
MAQSAQETVRPFFGVSEEGIAQSIQLDRSRTLGCIFTAIALTVGGCTAVTLIAANAEPISKFLQTSFGQ